jgi:hypothetical protein
MKALILAFLLSGCVINHYPKIVSHPLKMPIKRIITLVCDERCSDAERLKLPLIERKLNETIQSQCFSDFLLAPGRPYNHMQGETPKSVLAKMQTPQVLLVNYFYHSFWQLQGYEVAGESVVHINRNAIAVQSLGLCDEASIMAHEAAHAKGLNHRGNENNSFNNFTPPYQVNHAFDSPAIDWRNGGCCK